MLQNSVLLQWPSLWWLAFKIVQHISRHKTGFGILLLSLKNACIVVFLKCWTEIAEKWAKLKSNWNFFVHLQAQYYFKWCDQVSDNLKQNHNIHSLIMWRIRFSLWKAWTSKWRKRKLKWSRKELIWRVGRLFVLMTACISVSVEKGGFMFRQG